MLPVVVTSPTDRSPIAVSETLPLLAVEMPPLTAAMVALPAADAVTAPRLDRNCWAVRSPPVAVMVRPPVAA